MAVMLSELCRRPFGKNVERAWRVVEQSVALQWDSPTDYRSTHQWRSIMKAVGKHSNSGEMREVAPPDYAQDQLNIAPTNDFNGIDPSVNDTAALNAASCLPYGSSAIFPSMDYSSSMFDMMQFDGLPTNVYDMLEFDMAMDPGPI
ncbi:hypothetical protein K469DRAFT_776365 [Zopfia rhizophila CBS 207.26]|uniref:Uncharacterized protein n=1 Tax=Zopfia rhizophila CBS 207.26 TaxID=1314779 RepID=A0A6A6E3A8_9PEZI|nr:hypothetical protein K469DRAFT_776365 [Zopfia rhizophila CBS 207.26]